MRIIITHQHPIDAPGGGTRSCRKIINQLQMMGIEVILIFITPNPKPTDDADKIAVQRNKFSYLLSSISVANKVKEIINSGKKIDAVISWEYESAFLINLLKDKKIPLCMIAAHPSYESYINRPTNNWIKRLSDHWFRWRLMRHADMVFVSSDFTCQEMNNLLKIPLANIKKIYRGIDDIFINVKTAPIEAVTNLIFYGSFAPNKGVFDAVGALGKVISHGKTDWHLKLAGWGYEDELKAAVKKYGLEKQITLLGKLAPQDLANELKWAHVAILPSRAESFGRAIAEAQASSLAVISYNSGSIPELIENGVTGWTVPAGRIDLLANATVEAMKYPQKVAEMGYAGHHQITEKFTWQKTANLILEGIEEINQRYKA